VEGEVGPGGKTRWQGQVGFREAGVSWESCRIEHIRMRNVVPAKRHSTFTDLSMRDSFPVRGADGNSSSMRSVRRRTVRG